MSERRRFCLRLVALAALMAGGWPVHAGERRRASPQPPRTVAAALDGLERLLSPGALAALFATPDAELIEWRSAIADIMTMRWGAMFDDRLRPLLQTLEGEGVVPNEASAYLATSLVRRHRGIKLDAAEQLAPFRDAEKRKDEAELKRRRETGIKVISDRLVIIDVIIFPANSDLPSHAGPGLLDAVAQVIRGNPQLRGMEVQGHAAVDERDPRALSLKRARAVVDALIARGVSPTVLTAHGLGADYPVLTDGPRRAERDRRAEFLILPRPPAP